MATRESPQSDTTAATMLGLIAAGVATSRSGLARELGLAASTVSLRVQELIDAGLVIESGAGQSTGGRRPRTLGVNSQAGHVLVADLGARHARLGRVDLLGEPEQIVAVDIDVAEGPEAVLELLTDHLHGLQKTGSTLRGVALALPAPTNVERGWVESPSRMPGWHRFPVRDWLAERFGVLCTVENDANAMAVAEHAAAQGRFRDSILVKAGASVGCGIIIDGRVHQGATGVAGDITHVRVPAAGNHPCSCGNVGCLETIASGTALVRELTAAGRDVATTADVVRLASDGDPVATTYVRDAGRHLGETFSSVINFLNPNAVFLGGLLSTVEPFVAAVRSQLYEGCHPLATRDLVISRAQCGADAGIRGAGRQVLAQILHDARSGSTSTHPTSGQEAVS